MALFRSGRHDICLTCCSVGNFTRSLMYADKWNYQPRCWWGWGWCQAWTLFKKLLPLVCHVDSKSCRGTCWHNWAAGRGWQQQWTTGLPGGVNFCHWMGDGGPLTTAECPGKEGCHVPPTYHITSGIVKKNRINFCGTKFQFPLLLIVSFSLL